MNGYITVRIPATASKEEIDKVLGILEQARKLARKAGILDEEQWETEYEAEFGRELERRSRFDFEDDEEDDKDDEYMVAYEEDPVLTDEEEQAYLDRVDEYLMKLANGHDPDEDRGRIDIDPAYDPGWKPTY